MYPRTAVATPKAHTRYVATLNTRALKYFFTCITPLLHRVPAVEPGSPAGPAEPVPERAEGMSGRKENARNDWTSMKRLRIWKVLERPRGPTTFLRSTGSAMVKRLLAAVTTPFASPRRRRK